jgi:hypothetical protein
LKKNWLTTFFGLLAGLPQILPVIGLPISFGHIGNTSISGLLSGIGILGLGAVAKDFNKSNAPTPGPTQQVP